MPKNAQKDTKTAPELDIIDQAILHIGQTKPDYTPSQIGTELKNLGIVNNRQTVEQRLLKRDYLSLELTKLRERISENHTREVFPLAHKRMKKALKDKDLSHKDALGYVKLAYDKEMSDKTREQGHSNTVNIDKMQVILGKALGISSDSNDNQFYMQNYM